MTLVLAYSRALALMLLSAAATTAYSQDPDAEARGGTRIFLLTLGPGEAVWERFGHNGIVIEEPGIGSLMFDWGRFDFNQPGYVRRLMKGRMLYWTDAAPTQLVIDHYSQQNRSIWMQELNLTQQQAAAIRDYVLWNVQEANKYYRYDYYRDNCSTRIRDIINRALNGQLEPQLRSMPTMETYRSHTQRLTYDDPLTYTGLELAMGPLIDQPLTGWEESFIPMELMEWVRKLKVRDATGREAPLVVREVTVFQANRTALATQAPSLTIWYLLVGVLAAIGIVALGRGVRSRGRRITLATVVAFWCFVTGFFGTLLALLWAFTDHVVTYRNENLLQAHPLLLVLALFAPAALLARPWAQRFAVRLAWVVAGLSLLGFVMQILPGVDQVNGEIIALFLPIHLAIAYVLSSPRNTVTA